jgi:hypothetical protein
MAGPQDSKHIYDDEEEHSYPSTSGPNAYKRPPSPTEYTDDSYDPTNVGKPRAYAEKADASYYSDKHHSTTRALSYSDDGLNHHSQEHTIDESPDAPLVRGISINHKSQYQDLGVFHQLFVASSFMLFFLIEYAEPQQQRNAEEKPLASCFASAKYPLQQRIEDKKRGIGRQKYPFVGEGLRFLFLGLRH